MESLKLLNGKIFRSRIDGANFTCNIPFDAHKPECINSLFKKYENKILRLFSIPNDLVLYSARGIIIEATKLFGIYCTLSRKNYDIQIHIQFKGFFFINSNAFLNMKYLMNKLIIETGNYFRLTLIDIAQDVTLKPSEILPCNITPFEIENYYYSFKHRTEIYNEPSGEGILFTGFRISNSRISIKVYDKLAENFKIKNKIKKEYYENIYSFYVDENNSQLPITRVELSIKQEACIKLFKYINDPSISESEFITLALKKFSEKHSLRKKPINSHDQNKKRWPVEENWIMLFSGGSTERREEKTSSNFIFSNPKRNLQLLLCRAVEQIVFSNREKSAKTTPEDVMNILSSDVPALIEKAEMKWQKYDATQKELSNEFLKISELSSTALGMPITSPTSIKDHQSRLAL